MTRGKIAAAARHRRQGGNAESVNAVSHRIAIAVPVADDDRQPRRHRLQRRKPEGFLDIVAGREEEIRRRPDLAVHRLLQRGDDMHGHRRRILRSCMAEGTFLPGIVEPPRLDQMQLVGGPLRSTFQRHVHRIGIGLGVRAQPADEQRHEILRADPQPPAPGGALRLVPAIGRTIDAQRDRPQFRQGRRGGAHPLPQIGGNFLKLPLHRIAASPRSADQRVPRLNRGQQQVADGIHRPGGGDCVRQAAQAVGALIVAPSQKGGGTQIRTGQEQAARLRDCRCAVHRCPAHRTLRASG